MSTDSGLVLLTEFVKNYNEKNSQRLKVCDAFIVFFFLNAVVLFAYCVLIGSFPFNAFLSGLFANLGLLVFTVSLRMQVAPANKPQFQDITPESSFSEFCICAILLLLTAVHFMG